MELRIAFSKLKTLLGASAELREATVKTCLSACQCVVQEATADHSGLFIHAEPP